MRPLLLGLSLLLCASLSLFAQREAPSHYQLYGGYSFLSNTMNGVPGAHQPLNGWNASLAFPQWKNIRFKAEASFYNGSNLGAKQNVFFLLGGGEYDWRIRRETLYAEGLIGDGGINRYWGARGLPGNTASFASVVGGGLDTPVSRHLSIRTGADFQYSYFALIKDPKDPVPYRTPGLPTYFARITTGAVVRF